MKRAVRNIDTGEVFPSIAIAADMVGAKAPSISRAIRQGGRSGGYRWEYVNPLPTDSKPHPRVRRRNRPVQDSDGNQWANINEAAQDVGYTPATIYWAIYHQRRIGGRFWRYVECAA